MSTRFRKGLALAGILASFVFQQPASADVGFLLPSAFKVEEGSTVTAIASFSDRFPSIEHPLRSQDFHVRTADGAHHAFDDIHFHDQLSVLTTTLHTPGIYRFSSGNRLGRKGQVSVIDGTYVRLGRDGVDPSNLPPGSPLLTSQTETVSEVYVRSGDVKLPTTLPTSGRLSLALSTNDREGYTVASTLKLAVLFDGAPLPNTEVTLATAFDSYTDLREGITYVLNEEGKADLSVDRPGPYVVFARHISKAPEDAETDIRSYTTALVFEILP